MMIAEPAVIALQYSRKLWIIDTWGERANKIIEGRGAQKNLRYRNPYRSPCILYPDILFLLFF